MTETKHRVVCRIFENGDDTDPIVFFGHPKGLGEAHNEAETMRTFRDACVDHVDRLLLAFVAVLVEPVK